GWSDIPPFARREGGAVLNVAITQYVKGDVWRSHEAGQESLRISYGLDLPTGAGLGSSAALSVAWLALVHAGMGHALDRHALAQRDALEQGDFARTAGLVNHNWAAQKRLHPSVTNAEVERLFAAALNAGAAAGKACGAGGGGCLVFLADPPRVHAVRAALHHGGAQVIEARIDWEGVVLRSS